MRDYQKEDLFSRSACQYAVGTAVSPDRRTKWRTCLDSTEGREMTRSVVGGGGAAFRSCSLLCQPAEWQLNEYTAFGIIIYEGNPKHSEMRQFYD